MTYRARLAALVIAAVATAPVASTQGQSVGNSVRDEVVRRMPAAQTVAAHRATGAVRFIHTGDGRALLPGAGPAVSAANKRDQSTAFFREHGRLVGVTDPLALQLAASRVDGLGETHLTWRQFHNGVRVFAGTIKTHFDASHNLKAVTGTAIPDLAVNTVPSWTRQRAAQVAQTAVVAERGQAPGLRVGAATLYVYREGLAQGVTGENHLAWEIEVTDGAAIRDLVYVGAHTGKVIDRVSAVHDELFRRAYDGHDLAFPPQNYPVGAYWLEGQRFPTMSVEANNMIVASRETYNLFRQAFGRDSFDGNGTPMDAIFDRGYGCPNASWNGAFISFCPGFTTDDVTAHEWGHAYTQFTHGLIYQWQPGALNEAYSDIWGEVVDLINNRGSDAPGGGRTANSCSAFSPPVAQLVVTAPAAIAGSYVAQAAAFGPPLSASLAGDIVPAVDAADALGMSTTDACSAITNPAAVAGKIALVDRGSCEFSTKVLNVQNAGAIGAVVANNAATGLPGMGPGVDAPRVTIRSIGVQQSTGASIRAHVTTVSGSIQATPGADQSLRWLMGEDVGGGPTGAGRDMWNPTCHANPGKVSDTAYYHCATTDNGGVHVNSGIPNHAFSLLVDGGAYNGRTVAPIGLTKAAHIYFRAQSEYQSEASDFSDHADALEASCRDLIGAPLGALTGGPSGEAITDADCGQVSTAIAAVELRTPPAFCNFPSLLSPSTPPSCPLSTSGPLSIASFDFEADPTASWMATRAGTSGDFTPRDWAWTNQLPPPRTGSAFFAPAPNLGTCLPGSNETGVLQLTSPAIVLPASTGFARAGFDHWFATEALWDGYNVSVSVNAGPWQLVPPSAVTFNQYTALLLTAEQGNTNPLAGQPAWTGTIFGSVDSGTWGRTTVNLGGFASAGDTIRLRWNMGTDGCGGRVGAFVDNVSVFSCTPNVPLVSVRDRAITEGNAGSATVLFTVILSPPTLAPVAISFETVDGTAQHGNDFDRAAGTVVVPPGAGTAQIPVVVKGDVVAEGVETFTLRITGVTNATLSDAEGVGTIGDDDATP